MIKRYTFKRYKHNIRGFTMFSEGKAETPVGDVFMYFTPGDLEVDADGYVRKVTGRPYVLRRVSPDEPLQDSHEVLGHLPVHPWRASSNSSFYYRVNEDVDVDEINAELQLTVPNKEFQGFL